MLGRGGGGSSERKFDANASKTTEVFFALPFLCFQILINKYFKLLSFIKIFVCIEFRQSDTMKSVRNLQGNALKLSFTQTKAHGQTLDPLESTIVAVLLSVNQDALAFSRNIEHLIKSNGSTKDKKEAIDSKALQNAIRWRMLASLAAYAAALAKQLVLQRNVLRQALKNELPNYALFVSFRFNQSLLHFVAIIFD